MNCFCATEITLLLLYIFDCNFNNPITGHPKLRCMKLKTSSKVLRLFLFSTLLIFLTITAFSQNRKVAGKVVDDTGNGIPNVTVMVKGSKVAVQTDAGGEYSIEAAESATLVFSSVGFTTYEVTARGNGVVNITLSSQASKLNEVVVVGYGTQRKADLTGAVGSISKKDFANQPFTSPDQILNGRLAGVNVTNRSGDAGAPIEVRIRGIGTAGNNQPLWIIDGIPVATNTSTITVNTGSQTESNPLAGINPSDIESIDVLKDASATAIYGARANNGVILVTTKRGKSGTGMLTYDGYVGVAAVPKSKLFEVLNTEQYIKYQQEAFANDYSAFASKPNVDWQDLVFKSALSTTHNLTISGGGQNATYSFGAGYLNQGGLQPAQNFTRYSAKATSDVKVGKYLKFGESFLLSRVEREVQSEGLDNAGYNSARNALFFSPILMMASIIRLIPQRQAVLLRQIFFG